VLRRPGRREATTVTMPTAGSARRGPAPAGPAPAGPGPDTGDRVVPVPDTATHHGTGATGAEGRNV
jgi:hypothetical protein